MDSYIQQLFDNAKAWLENASPEERAEHYRRQKESWVRSMTTPCEHGALDFEQCHQCRNGE